MVSFFLCLAILICGYLFYGKFVDQVFTPDDRETPAVAINDGIAYVVSLNESFFNKIWS